MSFWSREQEALRDSARGFAEREVVPHLQVWEDAGAVPRALHEQAARLGLLGLGVPEELGGSGGTFLDALAVSEAFTEAGASSGLLAALFTSGIALPHIVAAGSPDLVDRYGSESAAVPQALTDYIRARKGYDYDHHGKSGNPTTDFVPDEVIERFCLLGPPSDHIARIRELESLGVDQYAVYLMHDQMDETLAAYGRDVIPSFR